MNTVNRSYKDSLFRDIFNDEKRLVEIYKGLLDETVDSRDIQLTTLDWTFFTGIRNDVSFIAKEEVFDMMNFVWDQERALEIRAEEAAAEAAKEAMQEGMAKGVAEAQQMILQVFPLLRKNVPLSEISQRTGCTMEYLQQLKAAMQ